MQMMLHCPHCKTRRRCNLISPVLEKNWREFKCVTCGQSHYRWPNEPILKGGARWFKRLLNRVGLLSR